MLSDKIETATERTEMRGGSARIADGRGVACTDIMAPARPHKRESGRVVPIRMQGFGTEYLALLNGTSRELGSGEFPTFYSAACHQLDDVPYNTL